MGGDCAIFGVRIGAIHWAWWSLLLFTKHVSFALLLGTMVLTAPLFEDTLVLGMSPFFGHDFSSHTSDAMMGFTKRITLGQKVCYVN